MQQELINSNHTPESEASRLEQLLGELRRLLAELGCPDCVVIEPRLYASIVEDAAALRHLPDVLRELRLLKSKSLNLWTVPEMAKQAAMSESAVRRRARAWRFTRCVAHENCRGGSCGCDLRFVAKDAADWVNSLRHKRSGR